MVENLELPRSGTPKPVLKLQRYLNPLPDAYANSVLTQRLTHERVKRIGRSVGGVAVGH